LTRERENSLYLPHVPLHPRLTSTADFAEAAYATGVFFSVVPSHAVRTVWGMLAPRLPASALLVSATKGIEIGSLSTMSQVLQATLALRQGIEIAVLSGPTFAREVSQGAPRVDVIAAASHAQAETVQQLLSTATFRVYTNT